MSIKSRLKLKVDSCFFCGKDFKNREDKHAHRLDLKKGMKPNNIIILCPMCKLAFQKIKSKIFNFSLNLDFVEKYFKNFDIDTKKIIISKIKRLNKLSNFGEINAKNKNILQ